MAEEARDPDFQLSDNSCSEDVDQSDEIRRSNRLQKKERTTYGEEYIESSSCSDDEDLYIDPCELRKMKRIKYSARIREKAEARAIRNREIEEARAIKNKEIEEARAIRIKEIAEAKIKKYDDIFSAVVENAKLLNSENPVTGDISDMPALKPFVITLSNSTETSPFDSDSDSQDDIIVEKTVKPVKQVKPGKPGKRVKRRLEPPKRKTVVKVAKVAEETPIVKFNCVCGKKYDTHAECHEHIIKNHQDAELNIRCGDCGLVFNQIYESHVCSVCGEFAADLNDHIASHYRNSTGKGAVMECRFCVKQFRTIREVMNHEQEKHLGKVVKRPTATFQCPECGILKGNYDNQLDHYMTHLKLNLLWTEIDALQARLQAVSEECPFCRVLFSSRKAFKAHVVKVHYHACKSLVLPKNGFIGKSDIEVKREVMEMFETCKEYVVKKEVKEEIEDEGYSIVE